MIPHMKRTDLIIGAKFLAGIALIYSLIRFGVLPYIDFYFLKSYTAHASSILLSVTGNFAFVSDGQNPIVTFPAGQAEIIDLCSGSLELVIMAAIIFATWDAGLRKRAYGFLMGAVFILVINPLRIAVTLLFAVYAGWNFAELIHGFLFKLTLLIVIAGFYYLWYYKFMVEK